MQADDLVRMYGPGALDPGGAPAPANTNDGPGGPARSEEGLQAFMRVVAEVEAVEGASAKSMRLAEWMRSEEYDLVVEAFANRAARGQIEGELHRMAMIPGLGGAAERLRKNLRERAGAALAMVVPLRVAGDGESRPTVNQILGEDLPLPRLEVPEGWEMEPGGVFRVRENDGKLERYRLTHAPMLVTALYRDLESHDEMLEIGWNRKGRWVSEVLPRVEVCDARELAKLSGQGAPVHSGNARGCVEYLVDAEAANLANLPAGYASRKMGWLGKKGLYFLAGHQLVHGSTEKPLAVRFIGTEGTAQLAEAVRPAGTMQGWLEAAALASPYPSAYLAVYAALAAPLLYVLPNCPNFIVDWSGDSGSGKTTAARFAASVWGLPEEGGGYLRSWAASLTGIERTATALSYMPTVLDESNKVPEEQKKLLGPIIYMVANGSGKVRGTVDNLQRVAEWRTVGISTGETRLTVYTQDEGTRARVICLTGSPLGADNADLAEDIKERLLGNFGHAGPAFVRWLIDSRRAWPELRRFFAQRVRDWGALAETDMARRAANYIAVLETAAMILHGHLDVPKPSSDPLAFAWAAIQSGSAEADRGAAALHVMYEWASSSPTHFWGRHEFYQDDASRITGRPKVPATGWRGAWHASDAWPGIGFYPEQLRTRLAQAGYEPDSILTKWKNRGWLKVNANAKGGGRSYPMAVHNDRPKLIVVLRAAFDEVGASAPVVQQTLAAEADNAGG